jgi:DNA repair protein SbcD/Mre11
MSISVIVPDLHLGKSLSCGKPGIGTALNSRLVDQCNILEWVLKQAIDFNASYIILTGDCFEDPKPHPTIISLFISWLKKCVDADMEVHIVAGNHDILRTGQFYTSALDIISVADIEGVYVYKHMTTLHTPGVSFTLMPFRDRRSFNTDSNADALQILSNKMPYELSGIDLKQTKIVVGHFAIEGSIPIGDEIDDMTNELFCPISIFKGYDYVWMGHVHKPQIISKSPFVAHLGSMDLSNFSESNQKKFILIFNSNEYKEPYRYLEIPTRPLNQISISVPENITDTTAYIVKELKDKYNNLTKSIVRLNISLDNPDVISIDRLAVENCLNDLGAFYITRINEERKIAPIKNNIEENIDNTVNEQTAIKMFADNNVDISIKNDFIALATQIVKDCSENKGNI